MDRAQQAKQNFLNGLNCTQAVLLAFADQLNTDEGTLKAVGLPMGAGMGRLRLTCGAVSGAAMTLGLLYPEKSKAEMYALVQEFVKRFREKNGSVICGELLTGAHLKADTSPTPEERTPEYYKKRPCPDLIYDAALVLEEMIGEMQS